MRGPSPTDTLENVQVVHAALAATPLRTRAVQAEEHLARYYARRAAEMEEAFALPARQQDVQNLRRVLRRLVARQCVLEVACGTGFWTQVMAETARSILATDINEEMLALARAKQYGPATVRFCRANAWALESVAGDFTMGVAFFWYSHMPRSRVGEFFQSLRRALRPGALVCLADNLATDHYRRPTSSVDPEGNTYQKRQVRGGEVFEIIKNYPSEAELREAVAQYGTKFHYRAFECFWLVTFQFEPPPRHTITSSIGLARRV